MEYFSDFVYGAIDGIISTFTIITAAAGASLSPKIIIIIGLSKMIADGLSMGSSSYLASKAEIDQNNNINKLPILSGAVTFLSFVIIGFFPLSIFIIPYLYSIQDYYLFIISYILTAISLFSIGALKGYLLNRSILYEGLQTLIIGGVVSIISYNIGSFLGDSV